MRPEPETLGDTLTRVMLAIVAAQPDPVERAAMLEIMRSDGHLPREEAA